MAWQFNQFEVKHTNAGGILGERDTDQHRRISQTNALVRALVEQETLEYPFWTEGFVTRCYTSHLGHVYFDLTDDEYTISCMLKGIVREKLDFTFSNGLEVAVYGALRVYEKKAQVQIDVEQARLIEKPPLTLNPSVQEALAKKGLWPRKKRPLPKIIRRIALITSKQSDALHDFEDTYRQENGTASIKLYDVRLQGQQAPQSISDAIRRANRENLADIIVLSRGGGRSGELSVFNDLLIAEAICRSSIPLLTGIGHQRDETLADQLADVSTITPTAAASTLAKLTQPTPQQSRQSVPWTLYLGGAIAVLLALILVVLIFNQ